MRGISRKLIESIAEEDVSEFADLIGEKVTALCSAAINELSLSVPFVNIDKTILQPANEIFNGGISAESEYIYFLAVESPQIEINCLQYNDFWKRFKERFLYAWSASKKKKRKKRKREAQQEEANPYNFQAEKYNLDKLISDLQIAISHNISETSIVYNEGRNLKVIGIDDFGPNTKILIYPVLYEDGDYKFLISRKKGFYKMNFDNRTRLISDKFERVGQNFVKMIKIMNALFRNSSRSFVRPNQIYIESLLYNTPDELFFAKDIYSVFKNIINYLNFSNVLEFKSVLNPDITLEKEKAIRSNMVVFSKLLSSISEIQ